MDKKELGHLKTTHPQEAMNHEVHKGHDEHEGHSGHDHSGHATLFKQKFYISLLFAVPILFLAPMMGVELFFQFSFPGSTWLVAILATILFFYGGKPFIDGAVDELKDKNPAMMTLISLGISVAYLYSMYAFVMNIFVHDGAHIYMDFFWELASLILIMLLGHWIEMSAVSSAGNALQKMAELLPNTAIVISGDGTEIEKALQEVKLGDKVLVKSGENIPTDGVIVNGLTTVNESMITGEARDVEKTVGDVVIGGSINGTGSLVIEVTGTGESGYLSQVMQLVSSAQSEKSKSEALSDTVAKWLFYFAVGTAIVTFIAWYVFGKDINIALLRTVTVLIIACPHALGLAIPLVVARSTSLGAQNGLLVKKRQALEITPKLDIIMMDKTGTLTEGNFSVNYYESNNPNRTNEEALALMGALEQNSSHPLSQGVMKKISELNLKVAKGIETKTIPGIGLEGKVDGKHVKIASVTYLKNEGIPYDEEQYLELSSLGNSVSFLIVDEKNEGIMALGDQIKIDSKEMVDKIQAQGIKVAMLTGDNRQSAENVAKQLGIDIVHAELLPEHKEKIVREYQDGGKVVMMVGDGINDAPSLARADVGVAIGAGTDVAIDSADVILVKSNPSDILHLLSLSRNTTRKMIQNLWWGAGYNIIAVPLAAGILSGVGMILSPAFGAVLMSMSTVIVAINAMTLRIDK